MEESQRRTTINYDLFRLDEQFKNDSNLVAYIDQAQNFYNSKQYPNENFNNMIRVTMNICSFSAQIKASKICGTPIYLAYTADNMDTDCNALSQFDKYNCNKMHLEANNYQAALNGYVNGTEITFIRWDADDTSYKGIYKGGLVEEHIDLRNFAVANPYIQDLQNQQWVMFWEDFAVGALVDLIEGKNKKEKEEKKKLILQDIINGREDYKDTSSINHAMVTLYTRFFRVKGEVYFMCSTKSVDIFEFPHPLSKKLGKSIIKEVVEEYLERAKKDISDEEKELNKVDDYKIDYEDVIMCLTEKGEFTNKDYQNEKEKFSLYPFAKYTPFARNRSFYGRSDIDQMIPVQKAINFAYSMTLKCMENNAYNKIIAKPDALQGQVITNEPSQIITDFSGFTNQWGIKFAESQPMPNGLLDSAERMFNLTRTVYGFSDVMDGSISNQDMSGYMLQQMIKQSNTSIEQQQKLFWVYNEEKAYIRLMYYKHYVDEAKYTYELSDAEVEGQEQAQAQLAERKEQNPNGDLISLFKEDQGEVDRKLNTPVHKTRIGTLKNEDIWGVNFDICIDAEQGVLDSQLVEQQFFDNLVLNGGMQNIDPEVLNMYLQASPNVSQRAKTSLKRVIENRKHSLLEQYKAQYQELLTKSQEIINYAKKLESIVGAQSKYVKNLQNEFKGRVDNDNIMIQSLQNELGKYRQPNGNAVTQGELKSNNSRGIAGSTLGVPEQ